MPLRIFTGLASAYARADSADNWFRLAAWFQREPLERAARCCPGLPGGFG
jgi:hypothetical protein